MINPTEIEKEIKASMRKCQSFAKREYGINKKCKLTLSTARDARSFGGSSGIRLYPLRHLNKESSWCWNGEKWIWREYKLIEDMAAIGRFETTDWKLIIRALVAHEFAHFIQGVLYHQGNKRMRKSHGEGWRDVYADLRWLLVNRELRSEQQAA